MNTAPTGLDAQLTVPLGRSISGVIQGFDAERDNLTFMLVGQPTVGKLTAFSPTTGAFTYRAGLTGTQDTFSFLVSDGRATALSAAVVTITYSAASLNGDWSRDMVTLLPATSCSGTSFTVTAPVAPPTSGKVALDVSSRSMTCASTLLSFPAAHFNVDPSGNILSGNTKVGEFSATGFSFSQSKHVAHCGVVESVFKFQLTSSGYKYTEDYTTQCVGNGSLTSLMN